MVVRMHDNFGYSVSIYNNYIFVGSRYDDTNGKIDTGSVYIYKKINITELFDLDDHIISNITNNEFGYHISLYNNIAFIGAIGYNNKGTVYVYERILIIYRYFFFNLVIWFVSF